jgi:hypothetical protein
VTPAACRVDRVVRGLGRTSTPRRRFQGLRNDLRT